MAFLDIDVSSSSPEVEALQAATVAEIRAAWALKQAHDNYKASEQALAVASRDHGRASHAAGEAHRALRNKLAELAGVEPVETFTLGR